MPSRCRSSGASASTSALVAGTVMYPSMEPTGSEHEDSNTEVFGGNMTWPAVGTMPLGHAAGECHSLSPAAKCGQPLRSVKASAGKIGNGGSRATSELFEGIIQRPRGKAVDHGAGVGAGGASGAGAAAAGGSMSRNSADGHPPVKPACGCACSPAVNAATSAAVKAPRPRERGRAMASVLRGLRLPDPSSTTRYYSTTSFGSR